MTSLRPRPFRLLTLGRIDLIGPGGASVDAILHQPKRLALLVYLAVANRGALCRRDTVLGVFWPEFDQERARAALRKALHFLRKELGDGVIIGRGEEEIGVDSARLACDLRALEDALDKGETAYALELYAGEFLDGFYVSDAAEFEPWLASIRRALRHTVAEGARRLTHQASGDADPHRTVAQARRWVHVAPHDEAAVRALMTALHAAGERAEALAAYTSFDARLRALDLEPSSETRALVSEIQRQPRATDSVAAIGTSHDRPVRRRWFAPVMTGGAVVGIGLAIVSIGMLRGGGAADQPTVQVHPLENMTGDSTLATLGATYQRAILDGIAPMRRVRALPPGEARRPATFSVDGSFHPRGDSLEFILRIEDRLRDRLLPAPVPVRAPRDDPTIALEKVRDRITAALDYYTSYWAPSRPARRPPDYDAYLAFQDALQTVLRWSDGDEARRTRADSLLRSVIERDPGYTEAYLLLGGFIFPNTRGRATTEGQPGQIGHYRLIDSLGREMRKDIRPVTEDHRLAIDYLSAVVEGDYTRALDALLKLTPLYPELTFRVAAEAVKANAPSRAVAAIRRLTPETAWVREFWSYWFFLTAAYHELGDYKGEAEVIRDWATVRNPFTEPQVRVRIATGDVEGMRALTQNLYWNLAFRQGLEARAHGLTLDNAELLAESERLLGWMVDRYDSDPDDWSHRRMAYWVLPLFGRSDEVVANLEAMTRDSVDLWYIKGMLGGAHARLGRVAAADSIDQLLAAADPTGLRGLLSLWRARIAAHLGRRDEAVELLGRAFSRGTWVHPAFPGFSSYWHTDPDFEGLRGYPPYERLIAPK